jgi:hypothetical protein
VVTYPGIRDAVRELLGVRMDALARRFHETHDVAMSDEIYRLAGEYGKLKEPWCLGQVRVVFVSVNS